MNIKWLYITALLILAGNFSSCSEKEKGKNIAYKTILYARGYGYDSPQLDISTEEWEELAWDALIHRLIFNQEQWENLLAPVSQRDLDLFKETDIDFKKYMIVLIYETLSTPGWSWEIRRITEYPDEIVVYIRKRPPPSYDFQELSGVSCIVKMPITAKNIEFKYI